MREHLGIDIPWDDATQQYSLDRPFFTTEERASLIAAAALVDVDGIDRGNPADDLGSAVAEDAARVVVLVHDLIVAMCDGIAVPPGRAASDRRRDGDADGSPGRDHGSGAGPSKLNASTPNRGEIAGTTR